MEVTLPNGTVVDDVPDGMSMQELMHHLSSRPDLLKSEQFDAKSVNDFTIKIEPKVTVGAPPITINVPQTPAPRITMQIPQQPAPIVKNEIEVKPSDTIVQLIEKPAKSWELTPEYFANGYIKKITIRRI